MKSFSVLFLIYLLQFVAAENADSNSTPKTTEALPTTDSPTCQCGVGRMCNEAEIVKGNEAPCSNEEVCCTHPQHDEFTPPSFSSTSVLCGLRRPSEAIHEAESEFAEFPWMVAILRRVIEENSSKVFNVYQCGASLIHPQVVLTAAHCVIEKDSIYRIRAGEWDAKSKLELFAHQDRDVRTVIIHPGYQSDTLINDVAVLILEAPVKIAYNVDVVCLPKQKAVVDGVGCITSGWGKYDLDGVASYTGTLQKLEVSIVSPSTCRDRLNMTNTGKTFELHNSFVCAGNEVKKYICKGNEGSPLVCPIPGHQNTYFQTGIVAYSTGCSKNSSFAVYTNVATFSDWIDEQVASSYFDTSIYKY